MEITVILSQENETLPKAELLARLETLEITYNILNEYPGIVELDVDASKEKIIELGSHLGYTHEILTTIDKTTPEKLQETIGVNVYDRLYIL
jgi:tRNA (guanine10-N2)-dimethyltransferase